MSETFDAGGDASLEQYVYSEAYSGADSEAYSDSYSETDPFVQAEDFDPDEGTDEDSTLDGSGLAEDAAPAVDTRVESLPTELRFGAEIGPYGETADSYAEKINWSTTANAYVGDQTDREIDPWTGTAKT